MRIASLRLMAGLGLLATSNLVFADHELITPRQSADVQNKCVISGRALARLADGIIPPVPRLADGIIPPVPRLAGATSLTNSRDQRRA